MLEMYVYVRVVRLCYDVRLCLDVRLRNGGYDRTPGHLTFIQRTQRIGHPD